MPGPSSRAMMEMPRLLPCSEGTMITSPNLAWSTMFRATSEMAVAITVRSDPSKPSCRASSRPFWRAITMSTVERIMTRISFSMLQGSFREMVQESQSLFQVEGRADAFQQQSQLHHGEGDVGLDADDDGLRPAQFEHVGDGPQRARGEGIDDIEHGDIDDDATGTGLADAIRQVVPQPQQVGVREDGLDAGDEVISLFEDRNLHGSASGFGFADGRFLGEHHFVAEQPFGLFDAALQVADGVHLA